VKRWTTDATSADEGEVGRVAGRLPESVLAGVRADTACTDAEVARLMGRLPDAVLDGARADTGSTAVEIAGLVRRLRRAGPAPWWAGVGAPALALAAALLVGAPVAWRVLSAEPAVSPERLSVAQVGALTLTEGDRVALGPSIVAHGQASLRVDQLHPSGAEVRLVSGRATFEVDPDGSARDLSVLAGEIRVVVRGTVFSVTRAGSDVRVEVGRGAVSVFDAGVDRQVAAGETWARSSPSVGVAARASLPGSGGAEPRAVSEASMTVEAVHPAGAARRDPRRGLARPSPAGGSPCGSEPCDDGERAPSLPAVAASPERLFDALTRAMTLVGTDPAIDRSTVEACNRFLDQHPGAATADDVRAFRVQAAFHSSRPSHVVRWADAFLASAAPDHPRRAEVERWRAIAALRAAALDAAQTGACAEALPLLRELVGIDVGLRREEAAAWRAICAVQAGQRDEARRALREVRDDALSPDLRRRLEAARGSSR
jgi:hypothetical protein